VVGVTVGGHPLAGIVTFAFIERGRDVRLEITIQARAAGPLDRALGALGGWLQDADWAAALEKMGDRTQARRTRVETTRRTLDDVEAGRVAEWADRLVERRVKETRPTPPARKRARRPGGARVRAPLE
jgi:hypothetical protein